MTYKGKEGIGGREEKWELASCVAIGKLYTVGRLRGSWQAVVVGDLYTISELCGSWQAVYLSDRIRRVALYNTRCTLPMVPPVF